MIQKAVNFASKAHAGQFRDDGETPYMHHLWGVHDIIETVAPDDINLRCAALLHDTLEDTETTYDDLVHYFNQDIADLVYEVTHEGNKKRGYSFPRLHSRRAIMLKFADRLYNISDMESWSFERKRSYLNTSKFWR